MPKLHWSTETKTELDSFIDPKTGTEVLTFPTASVYFPSGAVVHGRLTTKEQRKL